MRARRLAIILLVLLVLSCILPELILPPLTLAIVLVGGWIGYLNRVVPQVRINPQGVFSAATCLAGVIVLGHFVGRWLWREMNPAGGRWRMKFTLCAIAIVMLMFMAGMAAVGITHQTTWLVRSEPPMFAYHGRETASRVKCASNMRQIGQAIELYAKDHDGRLPDDLAELLRNSDFGSEVLTCPSSNDEKAPGATPVEQALHLNDGHHLSYVYAGRGLKWPLSDDRVILYENEGNHGDGGMNILFGDGHVEFFTTEQAQKLITAATTHPAGNN